MSERLIRALERMLEVQRVLMPGIRYISVPDYALLNDAPLEARAAIDATRAAREDTEDALAEYNEAVSDAEAWDRNDPEAGPWEPVYKRAENAEMVLRSLLGIPAVCTVDLPKGTP